MYGFSILRHPDAGSLVDNIDLPIHETGHLVFAPFGEFIQFLGGTLFQLIMPGAFLCYFLRRKDVHAASAALWWIAQEFLEHLRLRLKDARARGGCRSSAEASTSWAYLLGRLGWLSRDQALGHAAWAVGVLLYIVAIGTGLYVAATSERLAAPADALGGPAQVR